MEDRCQPSAYALTDLGTLGGLNAQAFDINEAGQVVGYAATPTSQGHAFLWQNGLMTDLGTLGGNYSQANALNESGQVVGSSKVTNTTSDAFRWQAGLISSLALANGATAVGNNDWGQIVGYYVNDNYRAFLWDDGVVTNLGSLAPTIDGGALAYDINNAGQVVGTSHSNEVVPELGSLYHAFVWQNGVMTDLGVLPGDTESGAIAINTSGQIVGVSDIVDPFTYQRTARSFLYDNGTMIDLGVPSTESQAQDINDAGQVVGLMRVESGATNPFANRGYIYENGVVTNLNTLIPAGSGLTITIANGVNNAGQIVGTAVDAAGRSHAVVLTPIPDNTPAINISDVTITEGNTGTRTAVFTVSLSTAATQPISVVFATANGSAVGSDFQAANGTLNFAPGDTTKTFDVVVNSDRAGELDETFVVNLSQATNAVIADSQGVGTIVDDEPRVSINDVAKNESNGGSTSFVFTVTLSAAYDAPVTVNFATANGTATAGQDYTAKSGTLTFAPGETSKTITILVTGDKKRESDETFFINLTGALGALIFDGQGVGTILNDDKR